MRRGGRCGVVQIFGAVRRRDGPSDCWTWPICASFLQVAQSEIQSSFAVHSTVAIHFGLANRSHTMVASHWYCIIVPLWQAPHTGSSPFHTIIGSLDHHLGRFRLLRCRYDI